MYSPSCKYFAALRLVSAMYKSDRNPFIIGTVCKETVNRALSSVEMGSRCRNVTTDGIPHIFASNPKMITV
jgi:hypothetical protein